VCLWKTCYTMKKTGSQPSAAGAGGAVKSAADSQDPSTRVVKTTTTQILPVNEAKGPELWEYLASLEHKSQSEQEKHLIYLYRLEPPPSIPLQKISQPYFTMPDNSRIPVGDQQEVEFAIAKHYGGGQYRIIVKSGPQWITQGRFQIGGPVKNVMPMVDSAPSSSGTNGSNVISMSDSTASIANKAIDTIAGQEHQAVRIGIDALGAAANIVRSFGQPNNGNSSVVSDDMTRQMMVLMMQRMMEDPVEKFVKLFALMREMGGGGNGGGPMVDRLMNAALDRLLNPVTGNGTATKLDTGAALVSMLPTIGGQFVEGLKAFAAARQAEAQSLALQRAPAQAMTANPQLIPPSAPAPAPAPANGQGSGQGGAPSMEFVETKILEIMRQPVSAEQAADDAMAFLSALNPDSVGELAKLGEGGLVTFFQTRPILKQATNNMPRLLEFIRAFLKMYAEDQAAAIAEQGAAAAAQPKPHLPN